MEKTTKKIAGVTGTLMLLSMGANAAVAFADDGISPDLQPAADEQVTGAEGSVVAKEKVAGAFSYTQSKVSSVADIVRAMGAAQSCAEVRPPRSGKRTRLTGSLPWAARLRAPMR